MKYTILILCVIVSLVDLDKVDAAAVDVQGTEELSGINLIGSRNRRSIWPDPKQFKENQDDINTLMKKQDIGISFTRLIRRSVDTILRNTNNDHANSYKIVKRFKRSPIPQPQPRPRGGRGGGRSSSSRSGKSGTRSSKGGVLIGSSGGVRFSIGGLIGLIITGIIVIGLICFGIYKCCKSVF